MRVQNKLWMSRNEVVLHVCTPYICRARAGWAGMGRWGEVYFRSVYEVLLSVVDCS